MPVIGLHVFANAVFFVGMQRDDHIPPTSATVAREQNATVGNRKDRIAEVAVFSADAIEIVAEVTVLSEPLRVVGKRAVLVSEWEIKRVAVGSETSSNGDGNRKPDRILAKAPVPAKAERRV